MVSVNIVLILCIDHCRYISHFLFSLLTVDPLLEPSNNSNTLHPGETVTLITCETRATNNQTWIINAANSDLSDQLTVTSANDLGVLQTWNSTFLGYLTATVTVNLTKNYTKNGFRVMKSALLITVTVVPESTLSENLSVTCINDKLGTSTTRKINLEIDNSGK